MEFPFFRNDVDQHHAAPECELIGDIECTQIINENTNTLSQGNSNNDAPKPDCVDNHTWGILRRKRSVDGATDTLLKHRELNGERDRYTLGRGAQNDVIVEGDNRRISSTHCHIYCDYSQARLRVFIEDFSGM